MSDIEIEKNEGGTSQLFIKDRFLETVKVKGDFSDDEYNNSLRIYCTMLRDEGKSVFNVQLRAFGNLHRSYEKSTAKDAQYISTTSLSINDVEEILAYMKKEERRYGWFEEKDGKRVWVSSKN